MCAVSCFSKSRAHRRAAARIRNLSRRRTDGSPPGGVSGVDGGPAPDADPDADPDPGAEAVRGDKTRGRSRGRARKRGASRGQSHTPRRRRRRRRSISRGSAASKCGTFAASVIVVVFNLVVAVGLVRMALLALPSDLYAPWLPASVGAWWGWGHEHEHEHEHGHGHGHEHTADVTTDPEEAVEKSWKRATEGQSYYSCLNRAYDTGPTWISISAPRVRTQEWVRPEGYIDDVHASTTLDVSSADIETRVRLLQPSGPGEWHLDSVTVYMRALRRASIMDRVDILGEVGMVRVWRISELLHAAMHHVYGATSDAMRNTAMWMPTSMNRTMQVYGFECSNATVRFNNEVDRSDPEKAAQFLFLDNDGEVTGSWSDHDRPPEARCAAKCSPVFRATELGCMCDAVRCLSYQLTHHGHVSCEKQLHVPHDVWHRLAE